MRYIDNTLPQDGESLDAGQACRSQTQTSDKVKFACVYDVSDSVSPVYFQIEKCLY